MNDLRKHANEIIEELQQERDELRVRIHLAKLEASDEWQELEEKLEKLQGRAHALGDATAESSKEVGAAIKLLGEEIKDGFKRIAKEF